ncbi:MarR family winged helix-turn-helix transcriptional regulator [Sporosarcina sp. CAU 1771]
MERKDLFKLIRAIEQMNNENIKQFTKRFQHPLGISPILVLSDLRTKGPQRQAELAESHGYTRGAMTSIADRLVKLGFVERLYDEADRRTVQLSITRAGEEALKEAQAIGDEVFVHLFKNLSEDEIAQYLKIQEKIVHSLN